LGGAASETVGGWFAAPTVILATADDALRPVLSYAIAFTVYVPAATAVHEKAYGDVVSVPSSVVPL
jgi:hypothetical protein